MKKKRKPSLILVQLLLFLNPFHSYKTAILESQVTEQNPGVLRAFGHMEGEEKWKNGKDEGNQISCFILYKRKDSCEYSFMLLQLQSAELKHQVKVTRVMKI